MLRRLLSGLRSRLGGGDPPADPQTRAQEVRAIGRDPLEAGPSGTERVVDALGSDSPVVRAAAAETLGSHQVYREVVPAEVLVERLDDPDRTVRLAAAESLSITTDAVAVRDVVGYAVDDDGGVRAAGAVGLTQALAAVPYELARAEVEALLEAFASADPSAGDGRLARESLLAAVAEGSTPGGLSFLGDEHTTLVVDALRTGAPAVREQAARVLGYVGREDVREPLEVAREDDGAVGDAAEAALRRGE